MADAAYRGRLAQLVALVQANLYLPDPAPFVVNLATVVANRLPGVPVWMMIVAPPSSGKTELSNMVLRVPGIFEASTLTEASLLSGTAAKERTQDATGGLLPEMERWSIKSGKDGILVLKDFTTVLSMNKNTRDPLLAALREIYDGSWPRRLGNDGGRCLFWTGRIGLLGGVTPEIERHHAVISKLGDRFLYYRLPECEGSLVSRRVISGGGLSREVKHELQLEVAEFIGGLDLSAAPNPSPEDAEWLANAAEIAATARTAVERDGYRRDIIDVIDPESPARLALCLRQLYMALLVIGCSPAEARRILREVVVSCIPARRVRLLRLLDNNPTGLAPLSMAKGANVDYPETTILRALDDMLHLRMAAEVSPHKVGSLWRLHQDFQDKWTILHS